tara:strand:- start:8131 stop:8472 length:342 start_codon:yes stop_codon:yes gene_type:complete
VLLAWLANPAWSDESPLQIVMEGRDAAAHSMLSEDGMAELSQAGANIVMYVCGALAICLTALALNQLYIAHSDGTSFGGGNGAAVRAAWTKLIIAGIVSIPAIIAAILPHAVL